MTTRPKRNLALRRLLTGLLVLAAALISALVMTGVPAAADDSAYYQSVPGKAGAILDYRSTEVNFDQGMAIPPQGWVRLPVPTDLKDRVKPFRQPGRNVAAWFRVRFSRAEAGAGPLAFATDHTAERVVVFLNGIDVYRSFSSGDRFQFGWNRPRMVTLPENLIRDRDNELVIRVDSPFASTLRLGAVWIGPHNSIAREYEWRHWARIEGPAVVNGVLAILTIGTLLIWLTRRREVVFGWLGLVGLVWMFRNLHYYIERPPFDVWNFWMATYLSLFALMVATYGFLANFVGLPNRGRFIGWLTALGVVIAVLQFARIPAISGASIATYATIPVSLWVLWVLLKHTIAEPRLDSILMFGAVALSFAMSLHDLALLARAWNGAGFYLQPYCSLLVFSVFGFVLARRLLDALSTVENMNEVLEVRIAEAGEQLRHSEADRRQLEVAAAVEGERSRLMREIHDGIGSNLVTALAVAQNQNGNDGTVETLKRSIADLRTAISSLEPTEGDLTLLLGSFRQRIDPELRKAGIALRWHVDPLPPLEWMEATNALHVLRIFQEIVANCIKHAAASEIVVHCRAQTRGGREGIVVEFLDNGMGIDPELAITGKGIANMTARGEALLGLFEIGPRPDASGTRAAIWLPFDRRSAARSSG